MSTADVLNEIGLERIRQVEKGHTGEIDDRDGYKGMLAYLGIAYARCMVGRSFQIPREWRDNAVKPMPRPASYRDALIISAALIVAEIDREDRLHGNVPAESNDMNDRRMYMDIMKRMASSKEEAITE